MSSFRKKLKDGYKSNRNWVWIVLAICTINALRNIGVFVSENLAHNHDPAWTFNIINEFTGSYTVAVLIPFLILFFKRYPLLNFSQTASHPNLINRLALYLFATLVFGFFHTSLMYLSRVPLYHLMGITRLDQIFNDLPYRYLMEYFKQFLTFTFIYLIYWAFEQYRYAKNQEIQAVKLSEDLLNSKLQTLQMQLHPHFFFNTLNTISSVMYKDPEQADLLISKLSAFLRRAIRLKNQPFHTVQEEMKLVDEYRDIMLSRYRDRLLMEFKVEENTWQESMPTLLLQPLLENAVAHGMEAQGVLKVVLEIIKVGQNLRVVVQDNGPGLQEGKMEYGVGIQNTLEKLEVCYGDRHQIEFLDSESGGLKVKIEFPCR